MPAEPTPLTPEARAELNAAIATKVFGVTIYDDPTTLYDARWALYRAKLAVNPDTARMLDGTLNEVAQAMFLRGELDGLVASIRECPQGPFAGCHMAPWRYGGRGFTLSVVPDFCSDWPLTMKIRDWAAADIVRWERFSRALEDVVRARGMFRDATASWNKGWQYAIPLDVCHAALRAVRDVPR